MTRLASQELLRTWHINSWLHSTRLWQLPNSRVKLLTHCTSSVDFGDDVSVDFGDDILPKYFLLLRAQPPLKWSTYNLGHFGITTLFTNLLTNDTNYCSLTKDNTRSSEFQGCLIKCCSQSIKAHNKTQTKDTYCHQSCYEWSQLFYYRGKILQTKFRFGESKEDRLVQGRRVKIPQGVLFAETVRMVVSAHPLLDCPMSSPSPQRKAPVENNDEDSALLG